MRTVSSMATALSAKAGLALGVMAIVTLPASSWWLVQQQKAWNAASEQIASEQRLASVRQQIDARLKQWTVAEQGNGRALQQARQSGNAPELWARRSIQVENQKMSRHDADSYLRGLSNGERGLFVPTAVNLRAANAGEGVFAANSGNDRPDALVVTIKGDYYSRPAQ
jgi:hypothetical protein